MSEQERINRKLVEKIGELKRELNELKATVAKLMETKRQEEVFLPDYLLND
jgi:phage shock protein A